ncbi:DDE_4 domain-containing protein, partial [Cephalotus follicularis]
DSSSQLSIPLKNLSMFRGEPSIFFSQNEISSLALPFKHALVGKFSHGRPPMEEIQKVFLTLDCIGAIDGVHVPACVSPADSIPFIGRKRIPTQNVMATCGFDMQFTFCWAGWEGTAHDTKIFYAALRNPELNFPHPPDGNQKIDFFFLLRMVSFCLFKFDMYNTL